MLAGRIYLSERMKDRLASTFTNPRPAGDISDIGLLSGRELEVFQLMGQGLSTARIAAALHISPSTVATHRAHIQEKLNLKTLTELVCRAAQWVTTERP